MCLARYSRQSFLGDQAAIRNCVVGIVGLGGGGSHVAQLLPHLGFRHYRLFDPDKVEDVNLNRMVGATLADVANEAPKIDIAARMINGLQESPDVIAFQARWQDVALHLRECDVVFGCIDGFAERRDLEACTRRWLIPLIDIGMDVHQVDPDPPRMGGQVILSMPGGPCLTCLGFLNEQSLSREAGNYGDAGYRPQVIWSNAVLAASAVGIAVDLLTDWTRSLRSVVYLSYDGNKGLVAPHPRVAFLPEKNCPHYPATQVGEPVYLPA